MGDFAALSRESLPESTRMVWVPAAFPPRMSTARLSPIITVSSGCFNSGHHSATTRYVAVRDGQERVAIDGNKLRARTNSDYSAGQLLVVEMTIQAYQYYVGLTCVKWSNLQVMLLYQVNQGRLAYNIDECRGKATGNVLHRGLPGAQQVRLVGCNAEAFKLVQYLRLTGKRIVGEKEEFLVMLQEPFNEFPGAGQ